jgi:hypothetical protein
MNEEALMIEWVNRKVEARCLSCKRIVHLCLEERTSRHWTHYGCGRVNFGEQYDKSLVLK